jgi:hypothetical protein
MSNRFETMEVPGRQLDDGTTTPTLYCVIDLRDEECTVLAGHDPENIRRACIIRNQPLSGRASALLAKLQGPGAFLTWKKVPAAAQELVDKSLARLEPHHNGESKLIAR